MAQRVQIVLTCDLHGDDTPGTETVPFGLDGSAYEIDLCAEHAAHLRGALAQYVGQARRAGGRPAGRRGRSRRDSSDSSAVRTWARERGIAVTDRGRIPQSLLEQYREAHS
jgi:hypothetical protein